MLQFCPFNVTSGFILDLESSSLIKQSHLKVLTNFSPSTYQLTSFQPYYTVFISKWSLLRCHEGGSVHM